MNARILKAVPALLLAAAIAGPASASMHGSRAHDPSNFDDSPVGFHADDHAYPGVTGDIRADVQSAVSNGNSNVRVSVLDGKATLTGYTDGTSRNAVAQVASHEPGITSVVNLITQIG